MGRIVLFSTDPINSISIDSHYPIASGWVEFYSFNLQLTTDATLKILVYHLSQFPHLQHTGKERSVNATLVGQESYLHIKRRAEPLGAIHGDYRPQ